MRHGWIVGVLDDLRTYAELNGLGSVARAIEAATAVAEAETTPGRAWDDRAGPGPRARSDREVADTR